MIAQIMEPMQYKTAQSNSKSLILSFASFLIFPSLLPCPLVRSRLKRINLMRLLCFTDSYFQINFFGENQFMKQVGCTQQSRDKKCRPFGRLP